MLLSDVSRLLIIKPSSLGDIVHALPAAAALRAAIADVHISFLVTTELGDLVRHCPDVDEIYTLPFPPLAVPSDPTNWSKLVSRPWRKVARNLSRSANPSLKLIHWRCQVSAMERTSMEIPDESR